MKFLPIIFTSLLVAATTALPTDDNPAVSENSCAVITQAQENRDNAQKAYDSNKSLDNLRKLSAADVRLVAASVMNPACGTQSSV